MSQRAGAGGSPVRRIWRKNIPESLTQRRDCKFCYDEFQNEMHSSFVGSVVSGTLQPIDIGQWRLGVERGDPFRVQLGGTAEGSLSSHRGRRAFFYCFEMANTASARAMAPGAGQRIRIEN